MKVGIDFGTTTCTIGNLLSDGRRSVHAEIPSIGAWKNGEIVFGSEARDMLRSDDRDIYPVRDLKLLLGKEETIKFGQTAVSTVDLAAKLMSKLISIQSIDSVVDSAVIATPVRVSIEHRKALREVAEISGVTDVRFVYEPTAALVGAQRFELIDTPGLFLVVDWGGGTLDIAVIRSDGQRYEELAVGGDVSILGGSKIDEAITDKLLDKDEGLRRAIDEVPGGRDRLKDEVEALKLEIVESFEGIDGEVEEAAPLWLDETIELSPQLVYEVLLEFTNQAALTILKKLNDVGIGSDEVHYVLFAGGVCKAPEIQNRIMADFPNARQITQGSGGTPLRSQELTGAGCTEITGRSMIVELAANIGIRQCDDSVCVMLEKGLSVELNSYRKAEFLVTDPESREATLDIGLVRGNPGEQDLMGWKGGKFDSMSPMFIPVGRFLGNPPQSQADWLTISVGVDENLAILVCAKARLSMEHRQLSMTGVPLVLRFV